MRTRILIAGLLLLAVLLVPLSASAADDGVINGKLVNKTAGGSNVSKTKVTLTGTNDGKPIPDASTGTNDKGEFEFKGVSTDKAVVYQITADYQGVGYESDKFGFPEGTKVKDAEVAVYEATMDSKDVRINLTHMIVSPGSGSLQVQEFYALGNSSDRSYAGSRIVQSVNQKETFRTSIPDGASAFEYLTGLMECCVAREQGNLIDTMAIKPGVKEIAFGYQFPYKSKDYTFSKTFEYPVDAFNFVIENKGMQVSGGGLVSQGPVTIDGKNFLVLSRKNVSANETLKINISGLAAVPMTASLKWWALGFVLVAVAAVIAYPRFRKRNALQPVAVQVSEREKIIRQIAKLDDDFEAGRIPEGTYSRLRAQKKAHLAGLTHNRGRKGS